jgi:hypothetical protein
LRLSASDQQWLDQHQQWLDWQAWLDRQFWQQALQLFRVPPELLGQTCDINRAMAETQQRLLTKGETDGD